MNLDADVLVLGGGCAGISLAVALSQHAPALRVHVLERRETYTRDRTWCFWNTEPHPFQQAVTHRWNAWRVSYGQQQSVQRSKRYTYDHLPADAFYRAGQTLMSAAGQELSLGTTILGIHTEGNRSSVETDLGVLHARYVFDSRPPAAAKPLLLQRFQGWHVRSERPCFNPGTVDLMDFQPLIEPGRTPFFYVLPFTETEALVEATYLDEPTLPTADAESDLRAYLDRLGSTRFEILYREAASLPMGSRDPRAAQSATSFAIGLRGGRVKPSSGYAFMRIQRQSVLLAKALATGAPLPQHFEPAVYGLLDSIFLRALQRFPDRVPQYFLAMFGRLPADSLVRFLSETASPREILRVMLALPKLDFMRAAMLPGQGSVA